MSKYVTTYICRDIIFTRCVSFFRTQSSGNNRVKYVIIYDCGSIPRLSCSRVTLYSSYYVSD